MSVKKHFGLRIFIISILFALAMNSCSGKPEVVAEVFKKSPGQQSASQPSVVAETDSGFMTAGS